MENDKNKSKESYLSKLKNTIVKHFTNTIKSEVKEYKDNMELKYDLPVNTKKSLAAYVQDMVKFNGSGKVAEKIRATKEELKELMASAKDQVKAALKGDKSKYDEDAMDDLLDEEMGLDFDDEKPSNESIEDPNGVDPGDKFEYTSMDYGKPEKSAAAIFIKMVADANIESLGDILSTKPETYVKELLDAAETLFDDSNSPIQTDQDKEIERLSKTIGNPAIGMERDSFEDVNPEDLTDVEPVIQTTAVGVLNPQQMEEFNIEELRNLEKEYQELLESTASRLTENDKSIRLFNEYVASVIAALVKGTESELAKMEDKRQLSLYLIGKISEGTIADPISGTIFIGTLLNIVPSETYQTFKDLNTKFNEIFNKN